MSKEKQETVEDIVAEMRNEGHAGDASCLEWVSAKFTSYADRFEAAAKREREAGAEAAQVCGEIGEMIGMEATREKPSQVGNAEKMREALEQIASMGEQIDFQLGSSEETVYAFRHERCLAHNISECARAALSAPPRNCDVGTADEQLKRFIAFCLSRKCNECPFVSSTYGECGVRWSQMPYEGGAK